MFKPVILSKRVSFSNMLAYIGFAFIRMPNPESITIKTYFKIISKANTFQYKIETFQIKIRFVFKFTREIKGLCFHAFLLAVG